MKDFLIECQGIILGEFFIPPFHLKAGEVVCWHMPEPSNWKREEQAIMSLTSARPDLRLAGKVIWADPGVMSVQGFWQEISSKFHRPLIVNKLAKLAGISRAQAEMIAGRHGVRPNYRVGGIAQNPRVLLALEIAWARHAEVVVFSKSGCDPSGVTAVYKEITAHLDRCAAIELSHSFWTRGQRFRECFPGATCLEVTVEAPVSCTLASSHERT